MTTASIKRLPLGVIGMLAAAGAGVAGYLAYLHYAFMRGDFVHAPACGSAGGWMDCHLVALSPFAVLAGRPVAAWGAALYAIWVALAIVGWNGEEAHRLSALRLITASALAAVAFDGYLAWLMLTKIHAVCIWCVATYAVNLIVLLAGWQALRKVREPLGRVWADLWLVIPIIPSSAGGPRVIPVMTAAWCLTILGTAWGLTAVVAHFTQGDVKEIRQQLRTYVQQQAAAHVQLANAPSHGATDAGINVVEFSDLLCPACQRASMTVTSVLANHPRDVRVTFKQYPLDQDCNPYLQRMVHPGACRVAAAASCAHAQDKFWPLHDLVFAGPLTYDAGRLENQARQAGLDLVRWKACLADGSGLEAVKRDVEEAHQLKVQSTPTFFVNGYMFTGGIPPSVFENIVQEFLHPAPMSSGVEPVAPPPNE